MDGEDAGDIAPKAASAEAASLNLKSAPSAAMAAAATAVGPPVPISPLVGPSTAAVDGIGPSAADLAKAALQPGSNVSFPQITEICERCEAEPVEVLAAVGVLSAALSSGQSMRQTLQALTIANEMMYNDQAVYAFQAEPGLYEALQRLRCVRDSGLGLAVDENVRMLATEVSKICFADEQNGGITNKRKSTGGIGSSQLSWDRFGQSAMNAMSKADRFMDKATKNTGSAMSKAGKTLERVSTSMMQEAEKTWVSLAAGDSPPVPTTEPHLMQPQ